MIKYKYKLITDFYVHFNAVCPHKISDYMEEFCRIQTGLLELELLEKITSMQHWSQLFLDGN